MALACPSMPLHVCSNRLVVTPPRENTAMTITEAMRKTMRPYSTAEAPESGRRARRLDDMAAS